MDELTTFENAELGAVRTLLIDGEPYFVGKDVAEILGYSKARNAIAEHVDEDDALKQGVTDSMGRVQGRYRGIIFWGSCHCKGYCHRLSHYFHKQLRTNQLP